VKRAGEKLANMRKSRRGRLMLAAALTTGFWIIAIPMCWP
jgi:hypothetical protein